MKKFTLEKIWEIHVAYTKELSTTCRQLGFASIAIYWIFKPDGSIILPTLVIWALIFSLLFFIFDISQYVNGAVIHQNIAIKCEKNLPAIDLDHECEKDEDANFFLYLFLKLKVTSLLISYLLLIICYLKILMSCNP